MPRPKVPRRRGNLEPAAGESSPCAFLPGGTLAVRFGYDRLALDADERAKIARAARTALERNAFVSVSALALPRGNRDIETRQAWRRAETIAEALAAAGVPAERIRLLQRAALAGEAESGFRRVDIVID